MAPVSAFAGVHYDMEDSVSAGKAYQQKYPMDYLEAVSIGRQMGCRVKVMAYYVKTSAESNAWYERIGTGFVLCYELDWKWKWEGNIHNTIRAKLKTWGYRADPGVRVWNYWNTDESYPIEIRSGTVDVDLRGRPTGSTDGIASIAMARGGEAIVIVSDFSGLGGTVRIKPDAEALGLPDGFEAIDFESSAETAYEVAEGEVLVPVDPYDFRMVLLKRKEGE